MPKSRAAYMRGYRQRQKRIEAVDGGLEVVAPGFSARANARIAELEEEVRHLKEELAKRPTVTVEATTSISGEPVHYTTKTYEPSFGHSRPAPKPGHP